MGACASKDVSFLYPLSPPPVWEGEPGAEEPPSERDDGAQRTLKLDINQKGGALVVAKTNSGRIQLLTPEAVAGLTGNGTSEAGLFSPPAEDLDSFRLLEQIGLDLQFSPGDPFIGQLVLRVTEVTGLSVKLDRPTSHYIVTSLVVGGQQNDKSVPRHAVGAGVARAEGEDGQPSGVLHWGEGGVQFVFFAVFSNSEFVVSLKAVRGGARPRLVIGRARVAVADLAQGRQALELRLEDKAGAYVGTVKAEADYRWLRGTSDDGSYTVINRIVVKRPQRAMRRTASGAVEIVSQVNHWLLSHDNVWPAGPAPEPAREPGSPSGEGAEGSLPSVLATGSFRELPAACPAVQMHSRMETAREQTASASTHYACCALVEALQTKPGESEEVSELKTSLVGVLAPMLARMQEVEQQQAVMAAEIQRYLGRVQGTASKGKSGRKGSSVEEELGAVDPFVTGHFEYGMGRPARQRTVCIFMRKGHLAGGTVHPPEFLGTHRTLKNGDLGPIPLPASLCRTPGHYELVGMLPDDYSSGKGSVYILERGTKAVVFDVDGTLTIGDSQVVTQFLLDSLGASTALASQTSHKFDLAPRQQSLTLVRAWAAKGYLPIYLSGRQGSYYNLTLAWLTKHRYPPGPIHLTRTHLPTLPVFSSVGEFKIKYLEGLKAKGIEIVAAYGNTVTDIKAYDAVRIPKESTFIVGPHGGKLGSVAVDNWSDHLPSVLAWPDSDVPIPYTELLWSERPGYKVKRHEAGLDGVVREQSEVATIGESAAERELAMTSFATIAEEEEEA